MPDFYEFFAGGGMARAGLGKGWNCLFANDIDAKKGASYATNWGRERLEIRNVGELETTDLPGCADLAWASFPCQDLSLAGDYLGLEGKRSGTFWLFWRLIQSLAHEEREPPVVVLENVCGALTARGGEDFAAIGSALASGGYRFGAVVIDAARFVPQSRPRLFIVGVREGWVVPAGVTQSAPDPLWHPSRLVSAYDRLPAQLKGVWEWWRLPAPPPRTAALADVIEDEPEGVEWHSPAETRRLLALMSPVNRRKVAEAAKTGRRMVGGVYRRTREDEGGRRAQRAEIRFDEIAGCLRTPAGGSSRQTVMIVHGDKIRSRLLAPREAARLMGLPDSYRLPGKYNDAYHLAGDGVVVPVVRFLALHILEPLVSSADRKREAA
jgi:DNA (cytosine-5)-methyltransferase 1